MEKQNGTTDFHFGIIDNSFTNAEFQRQRASYGEKHQKKRR